MLLDEKTWKISNAFLIRFLIWSGMLSFAFVCVTQFVFHRTFFVETSFLLSDDAFFDFAELIKFCLSENPYQNYGLTTSYPPLIMILCYPFALICKNIVNLPLSDMIYKDEFYISLILFSIFIFIGMGILLYRLLRVERKKKMVLVLVMLISSPMVFALSRGNIVFLALLFTLVFVNFYRHENRVWRELALIALAAAGAIKIYPLFFGLLLLREKRLWESCRVAIYFFVLFLLPFCVFESGLGNVPVFIQNLLTFVGERNESFGVTNVGLFGLLNNVYQSITMLLGTRRAFSGTLYLILAVVVFSAAIISGLFLEKECDVWMLIAGTIIAVPTISYFYAMIFLLIPFCSFVSCLEKPWNLANPDHKANLCYYVAFLYIFNCITMFWWIGATVQSCLSICMTVYLIGKGFKLAGQWMKNKKNGACVVSK